MVWGAIAGAAVSAAGNYLTSKSQQKSSGASGGSSGAGGVNADTMAEATAMKDKAAEQQLRMGIEDAKRDMYYQPLLNSLKATSDAYKKIGQA